MTRDEQKELLTAICNNVRDHMLARAGHWPVDWDGHELRDLCAMKFEAQRSNLMQTNRKRRRDFLNTLRTTPI